MGYEVAGVRHATRNVNVGTTLNFRLSGKPPGDFVQLHVIRFDNDANIPNPDVKASKLSDNLSAMGKGSLTLTRSGYWTIVISFVAQKQVGFATTVDVDDGSPDFVQTGYPGYPKQSQTPGKANTCSYSLIVKVV